MRRDKTVRWSEGRAPAGRSGAAGAGGEAAEAAAGGLPCGRLSPAAAYGGRSGYMPRLKAGQD